MKKIVIAIVLLATMLLADVKNVPVTQDFLKKGITIIDIRTPGEWKHTGIIKGAHPIMFFDERGRYNVEAFIKQLNKVVKKDEPFAIICHTGSRTSQIAPFLSEKFGYDVINLQGGMDKLAREGYKAVPYRETTEK